MMSERQIELLQRYLDGECSEPEIIEAEQLLLSEKDAHIFIDKLRRLSGLLENLPNPPFPERISLAVMNSIPQKKKNNSLVFIVRAFIRTRAAMAEMTRKNKLSIIAAAGVIIISSILYIAQVYPPSDSVSGTIGKADKYRSQQMAEQDVTLRNILLDNTTSVKASIIQLKNLKTFAEGLRQDMTIWMKQIGEAEEKIKSRQSSDITAVQSLQKQAEEYITFITANSGIIDQTIGILEKIDARDSTGSITGIGSTLAEFENFRVRMSEKFIHMMVTIPDINTLLVKNGQPGIIDNKDAGFNLYVCRKEPSGSTNSKNAVYHLYCSKAMGGRFLDPFTNKDTGIKERQGKLAEPEVTGIKEIDQLAPIGIITGSNSGFEFLGGNGPMLWTVLVEKNSRLEIFSDAQVQIKIFGPL